VISRHVRAPAPTQELGEGGKGKGKKGRRGEGKKGRRGEGRRGGGEEEKWGRGEREGEKGRGGTS